MRFGASARPFERSLLFAALALSGCSGEKVADDLTGIELTLRYDPKAAIDQIEIAGTLANGTAAFMPGRVPETPRPLTEGENSVVILLADELAGEEITVRADGLAGGEAVLTTEITVTPVAQQLVPASGMLTPAVRCGDGMLGGEEACDDGNTSGGDGCSATCTPEPGYTCTGEPSDCSCEGDVDDDGVRDCDDTCIDADNDGYGEGGGAGNTCTGPDCDDDSDLCTTTCEDTDGDQIFDCADLCIDEDGDGYGTAGGGGNDCAGADCDDTVMTCTTDCVTDDDQDGTADCADLCIDADQDGYGLPGGAGNDCTDVDCDDTEMTCTTDCIADEDNDGTIDCLDDCIDVDNDGYGVGAACTGPDCDDAEMTCNTDCTTDADNDATIDCLDTCIDADSDGFGIAGGAGNDCTELDCDDTVATCTNDCTTDLDNDGTPDCADGCIDMDGDGYGTPGGAPNTCVAADCLEGSATCTTDCLTDADNDTTPDCEDGCIDMDGDGYGVAGGAPNSCAGPDCDDNAPGCNVDCSADVDNDGIFDCTDTCIDVDEDGYGAGTGCTGPDCNDAIGTCTDDCVTDADGDSTPDCDDACIDQDGDGYGTDGGAGSCLGADCDETRVACNVDCVACLPQSLVLTSNGPVAACTDVTLSVDLDGYDNAAGDLSCTAPQIDVLPLENFDGGFARWSSRSSQIDVYISNFPDGFPQPSCNGGNGNFVRIENQGPDWFELATPLDATNLENLQVSFRVGYRNNPGSGQNVSVQGCCGAGCTPVTFGTADNGSSGGTDDCTDYSFPIPAYADDCASLMLRFFFPNASGRAAVDDVEVRGDVILAPVFVEQATGIYTAPFSVCEPATVPVTCTWDDGNNTPLSDTDSVVFQ